MRRSLLLCSVCLLTACQSGGMTPAQLQTAVQQLHQANGAALQVSAALCKDPKVALLVGTNPDFALACAGVGIGQVAHEAVGQALATPAAPAPAAQ